MDRSLTAGLSVLITHNRMVVGAVVVVVGAVASMVASVATEVGAAAGVDGVDAATAGDVVGLMDAVDAEETVNVEIVGVVDAVEAPELVPLLHPQVRKLHLINEFWSSCIFALLVLTCNISIRIKLLKRTVSASNWFKTEHMEITIFAAWECLRSR